VALES